MNNADKHTMDGLGDLLDKWQQSVSLTNAESGEILANIMEVGQNDWKVTKQTGQVTRLNRIIAFANRSMIPYSERHRIFVMDSLEKTLQLVD